MMIPIKWRDWRDDRGWRAGYLMQIIDQDKAVVAYGQDEQMNGMYLKVVELNNIRIARTRIPLFDSPHVAPIAPMPDAAKTEFSPAPNGASLNHELRSSQDVDGFPTTTTD